MNGILTEYKHTRAYKLNSQFKLPSVLPSRFPKYFLGVPQKSIVVEHVLIELTPHKSAMRTCV